MLLREKADQAQALLAETGLDCWLTFVRETSLHPDPALDLVVGANVVRNAAFLFHGSGERVAIVPRFDLANVQTSGVFQELIPYDEDIRGCLVETLQRLNPKNIGLNFSLDDVTADGLTYGHWLLLNEMLKDTPFLGRLTSAAPLLARLRGRKSSTEVERIRQAIASTEEIFEWIGTRIRPGMSELEIAGCVRAEIENRNLEPAWERDSCPLVNCGPASDPGHARPRADIRLEPGHLVHMDLGVRHQGFCSDLQRMWYVRRPGEATIPRAVERAFNTVVRAIEAGARALRPGVRGHEVDAAARQVIVQKGYPEFKHGLGHSLGRGVHDGGTLLGPRWPCYGQTVEGVVEAGNVFTLELGVPTEAGFIGLEEDVLVTIQGCEFLSSRQSEIWLVSCEMT
jgi:Xaa-Pro aminopeptidase